jgi:hypothetical protein
MCIWPERPAAEAASTTEAHHAASCRRAPRLLAAAKLRQQVNLDAPTIQVVLDRLDLIEQIGSEFASVGLPGLRIAEMKLSIDAPRTPA